MTIWKANADEKRAIRAVAAMSVGKNPGAIVIEIGERCVLDGSGTTSTNLLAFGDYTDALDRSDLHQPLPWTELDSGIELVDGKAIVDFNVREKIVIGDCGEHLTNVQAHVEISGVKPRLMKITGTGITPITGEALWACMVRPRHRAVGSRRYNLVNDWLASF